MRQDKTKLGDETHDKKMERQDASKKKWGDETQAGKKTGRRAAR